MKKLFTLVAVASMTLVACGPSAEEIAKKEQMMKDSIAADSMMKAEAAAAQAQADSMAQAAAADSAAKAQAMADSIAAATKGGKKK